MREPFTFVGMDVHWKDIAVAMLMASQRDPLERQVANAGLHNYLPWGK